MSLILDALKKSEQARTHVVDPLWSSPILPGAPSRIPRWAWVLIALLVFNVVILLMVIRLRPPSPAQEVTQRPEETALPLEERLVDSATVATTPTGSDKSSRIGATSREADASSIPPAPSRTDRGSNVSTRSLEDVPSRDNLLARGATIPSVSVTLHVFDATPSSRFILMDGERLGEGDISRTGLKVTAIKAEGVVFSFGDYTFKVTI